jgi:hypothetical protein
MPKLGVRSQLIGLATTSANKSNIKNLLKVTKDQSQFSENYNSSKHNKQVK